ncbi:hypothetical protein Gpo141_00004040 [Globisporangium polare]
MAIGESDALKQQPPSEPVNKLSSSMIGGDKSHTPVKRRPRGNFYGKHLWGPNAQDSGELDYVRKHGEELIHKVLTEDDHWKYVSLKQVHDVRLYTPVATPEEDVHGSVTAAAAAATASASASRSLSSTSSSSSTKDRPSATRILPGRCDFRAMTRLPGSIDTVMEILAADDDREAYWTAINTQKGLRACNMFGSRRLNVDEPFPRWSQRYVATRFTKYSTKSVDFCFAEYAKFAPVATKGELRRGFIYRRSVDESLFEMDEIKARLAKYDDECERMYIQDWLYEVSETAEENVCKVILTCQVYFSGDYSRSLRSEFHEFTTEIMVQLRKVMTKHWREQHGGEAADESSLGGAASKLLNNAFKIVKPGQSRYCGVCSATFSLMRKRYTCRTCCVSMCSKCSKVAAPKGASILGNGSGSTDKNASTKECILCYQFSDETSSSRSSSAGGSHRRHFVTPGSTSVSEYDDEDSDDGMSLTSSSRSILGAGGTGGGSDHHSRVFNAARSLRSQASASTSATPTNKQQEAVEADAPAAAPASAPTRVVRKVRNGSSDSTASSKSVPESGVGVVLFSDLDALTLSGRVRGPKPTAASKNGNKRPVRTVSEDNVLHAKDSIREESDAEEADDLAHFNLKLK